MAHQGFVNKLQTRLLYVRPALIVYPVVSFAFEKFENGASAFRKQAANTALIYSPLIVYPVVIFTFKKFENGASAFRKQAADTTLIC